ncbi:MAG: SUMF1/EgtB/PvdO family nonheme iron enzyme [Planctomycetota bacterium]
MKRVAVIIALCLFFISGASFADTFGDGDNQFEIDFVPISGNTNPASGYGVANYDYRIGTCEITNDQWSKFEISLGVPVTGSAYGAYDANPNPGTNLPTDNVSWYEAAQFVNWLNTNSGYQAAYNFTGTQGTTNYTLELWDAADAWGGTNLYRHKNARYFLPSEDEWVKAAYWNGSDLQTYANAFETDLISNEPDPEKWNYFPSDGSELWAADLGAQELNGTYNMMGNVWEWMESSQYPGLYFTSVNRGIRGGSYISADTGLRSSYRNSQTPDFEDNLTGFRVASVPEPMTVMLLGMGGLALWSRRK